MNCEIEPIELTNGTSLTAAVAPNDGIAVQLHRGQHTISKAILPYPSAGLAGGRLIPSPSERLAVLSMFSGQSEEGYELFRINETVAKIGSLSYQAGEVASFCFSPDESLLVMVLPFLCSEW